MFLPAPFRFGRVRWRICQPVPPSRGCGCCSITLRRSRIPGKPGRSAYPLREVLFLVVCGTIASGDDYDDIVDWGKAHLSFLRGFAEFHFGIPCADWLRCVMNRINPDLAQSILDAGADYLLAVKDNQPTLHADIESYFETAPSNEVAKVETMGKDHGRFEVRNHTVSAMVDWYAAERSYPGAPRFPQLTTIAMVESRIERGDKIETERRSYISSRALSAAAFADAARGHWAIENTLHWVLDTTFREDLSRLRIGHGAKNMAVVRHFALNLIRQANDKLSIRRRRTRASWDPDYLLQILGPLPC